MRRLPAIAAVLLFVTTLGAAHASAQTVLTGEAGHAFYRIVVPDNWNGQLVIWNHGISLSPPGPVTDLGPLANVQLAEGYAVAASSFRQSGWALFKSTEDVRTLYQVFVNRFGTPDKVLMTGGSLGGLVSAAAIEQGEVGNVVGALSVCGAVAGSRTIDLILDARLVYDALCASVPGAFIPGSAEGLPAGSTFTSTAVATAVNACFGILTPPALQTPAQQARLATFASVTSIPLNFVLSDMGYATFGLSDLVHDPGKLKGRLGTGNEFVSYGNAAIDASIARVSPHPGAANRLSENYTPTGAVGSTKIVALYTDKDGLVVVEGASDYASKVPAANLTTAVAVEAVPSHCGFSPAEVLASWESLRGWVAGAPKPTAAAIQGLCTAVAPGVGGPCRIDPAFVVPPLDSRIRPR
jgi:hypothetical protein